MLVKVTLEEIAKELESFVRDRFEVDSDDTLFDTEVNLWEEGYVDSAGVVELIAFLEENYSVAIPKAMLFDPEFTSITGIAERIAKLI